MEATSYKNELNTQADMSNHLDKYDHDKNMKMMHYQIHNINLKGIL